MKFVKQRFCVSKLITYLLLFFWFSRVFLPLFVYQDRVLKCHLCWKKIQLLFWLNVSHELEVGLLKLTSNSSQNWCDKPAVVSVSFSFSLAFLLDFGVKEFHNNLVTFSGLVFGLKVLLLRFAFWFWLMVLVLVSLIVFFVNDFSPW